MDISWSRWAQIWQIYPYIGWQFQPPSTDISWSRWVWIWQIYLLLDMLADLSPGTDILWSRWVQIWQIYPYICWHIHPLGTDISCWKWFHIWQIYPLVLTSHGQDEFKYGRSTPTLAGSSNLPILTSHGQDEFKFGRSTPRTTGRSTTWYLHLVVKISSNLADIPLDLLTDLPPGTDISWWRWVQIWQINPHSTDILWWRWVPIWQIYP